MFAIRRRVAAAAVILVSGLVGGSCLPDVVFVCGENANCAELGPEARCEEVGFCSRLDAECASGHRFHEFAGDNLASTCVLAGCGDGVVQSGEACDDGNDIEGDGCNPDCTESGVEQWVAGYSSPGDLRDRCYAVAVDEDGNVGVIGHVSTPGQGWDLWVRQYSPSGEPQFTWVLNGEGNTDEEGWSIRSVDGEWVVVGSVATATQETNVWIGRLDATGVLQWQVDWDGQQDWLDAARDVVVADNGELVVIGYATVDRDAETDLWFQRRSADGQQIRWTKQRAGLEQNAQDRGHGIASIPGGFVGVGMKQTADQGMRFWLEHFDDEGETIWADEGVAGSPSVLTSVTATPAGNILLAGWKASAAGDTDMWLQERGPGGAVIWDETIASPGGDDDKANVVVSDERGGFVVGGELGAGSGSTDVWIRRYSPERAEVWTFNLSGPAGARDTAWGLDIGPDGSVYACGYQATPDREWDLWVRRFTP